MILRIHKKPDWKLNNRRYTEDSEQELSFWPTVMANKYDEHGKIIYIVKPDGTKIYLNADGKKRISV